MASAVAGKPLDLPLQEVVVRLGRQLTIASDTERSLRWSWEGRQFPLPGSEDHLMTSLGSLLECCGYWARL